MRGRTAQYTPNLTLAQTAVHDSIELGVFVALGGVAMNRYLFQSLDARVKCT